MVAFSVRIAAHLEKGEIPLPSLLFAETFSTAPQKAYQKLSTSCCERLIRLRVVLIFLVYKLSVGREGFNALILNQKRKA